MLDLLALWRTERLNVDRYYEARTSLRFSLLVDEVESVVYREIYIVVE